MAILCRSPGFRQPTSLDQMNWHVTGLAGLTAANGNYVFSVVAAGSGIHDLAGNALASDAIDAWRKDDVHPVVDITPVSPDPTNASVEHVTITFSKPVTGLELSNLVLSSAARLVIDWTDAQERHDHGWHHLDAQQPRAAHVRRWLVHVDARSNAQPHSSVSRQSAVGRRQRNLAARFDEPHGDDYRRDAECRI